MKRSTLRVLPGFAIVLVLAGLMSTFHPSATRQNEVREFSAATEKVPIPVCPPSDPGACGIDKW